VLADDLLVGNDRWRMTSLAVEPDGSVMMSVVPSAVSAICPVVGRGVLGGIRGIDVRHWICPGASSPCGCASGRGGSSATNQLAHGRSLRSASRDCCRAMAAGRRRRLASCWRSPNELAVKREPDSRELRVCQPVQIPCAVCCGTRSSR
jgi:hypothetical protein